MKKLFFFFVLAFLFNSVGAQKVINDANVEKRTVGSFHGIDVGTGIELMLSEGSSEEVAVSAIADDYRDRIITKVENGILKIYYDSKFGSINRRIEKNLKAYVSYKNLDHLSVNTGAEVKIDGILKSGKLDLDANTGGLVDGEVNVGTLRIDQNTGSKITLSGKVDKLEAEGNTGSKFRGEELLTGTCDVSVHTGAQIFINVEKSIQARANTGGLIRYKGKATQIDISRSTGGSITKI